LRDPVDLRVALVVADPWELSRDPGTPPRFARVAAASADPGPTGAAERLLLELEEPIEWRGTSFRFVVVQRRGGTQPMDDLVAGRSVECNFIGQPDERVRGGDPLDTSSWRGGLAGSATVRADP